jgi:hypothetical protein
MATTYTLYKKGSEYRGVGDSTDDFNSWLIIKTLDLELYQFFLFIGTFFLFVP